MRKIFVTFGLLLSNFVWAGANCPTMSSGNTIEKYPYPDSQGYYAALQFYTDDNNNGILDTSSGDSVHYTDTNSNNVVDPGETLVSMNQACMLIGECPSNYGDILVTKYAEEAADSTCTTMVDATARTLNLAQFSYNKTATTCTISTFAADFNACEKIYWQLCRKETSGHDCYDGDYTGSNSGAGVFPSHILTAYSYVYNYGRSVGGGGGGGKGGGGGNLCKLVSGAWSCN
jgi:hypothetical protein